ncbi:hypothetical protein [Nocardia sp. alder85J]|uniref:hypothetical protein n=1 Tax=Nocardia sp. alder85J TaxID=2862949 RepID=UPI001CD21F89|nr:hypothetical protein [Nocardia sp. alder85J]MCX4094213.1 hypothetical protein [Nocardia sp. alder85J]
MAPTGVAVLAAAHPAHEGGRVPAVADRAIVATTSAGTGRTIAVRAAAAEMTGPRATGDQRTRCRADNRTATRHRVRLPYGSAAAAVLRRVR